MICPSFIKTEKRRQKVFKSGIERKEVKVDSKLWRCLRGQNKKKMGEFKKTEGRMHHVLQ